MKRIAIMQPYFLPYIGYWQLIHAVDCFVIYDDVNYIKGGWINRNRILINGEPAYITVPLQQSSPYKRICDITLQPSFSWRDKLTKMVEITYRKAPCFAEVFPIFESLIRYEANNLSDYLAHQLQILSEFMGIETQIVASSRCYENELLSGEERVLDICAREAAQVYCNLPGGRALYDAGRFSAQGIELKFLQPGLTEYRQFSSSFQPWLSILDVLMFNDRATVKEMLGKCEIS